MTARITSNQEKQYKRFVEDASNRALKEVGPDKEGLQRLFGRGDEFQAHLVEGIRQFTANVSSYSLAKSILGDDFISLQRIQDARGLIYTKEQLEKFYDTLPSKAELKWCRDNGYGLMPQPPSSISLLDVRAVEPDLFYAPAGGWYESESFAKNDLTGTGWLAIKKTPVDGSTIKNWDEQNKLLSGIESVPNAAEMSWFITTFYRVRGVRLFEKVWVRTSSLDSFGSRAGVGWFDSNHLYVRRSLWDSERYSELGLASVRKFG